MELGVLVLARDNGDVEVWEFVEPEGEGQGNWVLEKVSRGWGVVFKVEGFMRGQSTVGSISIRGTRWKK